MTQVSIIIPNWNGGEMLYRCIKSIIEKTEYKDYEIVIVDNGSVDDSDKHATKLYPTLKIIKLNKNYGFPIAVNKGIQATDSKYVLLLNNDVEIVQGNWINKLIEIVESDVCVGAVGCMQRLSDGNYYPSTSNMLIQDVGESLSGNGVLVKRSLINKIGDFDEQFSPFLYEDTDFFMRAKKAGYKVMLAATIEIYHHQSASIKKHDVDYVYYVLRKNRRRYVRKHVSLSLLVWSIKPEISDILSLILHPKRIPLYFKAM